MLLRMRSGIQNLLLLPFRPHLPFLAELFVKVLINCLQRDVSMKVKQKLQTVKTRIFSQQRSEGLYT
ncbi:hypothetical protein PIB30_013174 [Stylosanthes scabra]|uniref:Uncharacterized protein n=1 Tax=Stylosanthes scabra TaxID=79078 RepID=A0ABU6Y4S7_9FABA|nr:hypothetical protein [Stylosanthes scabra]